MMRHKFICVKRAFTILELLVTILFVVVMVAPILNSFQLSERMGEKSRKSFIAQNLAREMMKEISQKPFSDPDESDTFNVQLKPGASHEEYLKDSLAATIANGTDETTGKPRLFNETLVSRIKFFDDIDDYDGYNTDETLLPTAPDGGEFIYKDENAYKDFRVKVAVKNGSTLTAKASSILNTSEIFLSSPGVICATKDSKYLLSVNESNEANIINMESGFRLDNQPDSISPYAYGDGTNTSGSDPVSLADLRERPCAIDSALKIPKTYIYKLGKPKKAILGPGADRFYILHSNELTDQSYYSAVSAIDMNRQNTPEVSFHKVETIGLVARDLRSNSINAIIVDDKMSVFAATNGAGIMKSTDNGESWEPLEFCLSDAKTPVTTVNCLASGSFHKDITRYAVTAAGGNGGLFIIKNSGDELETYREPQITDSENVTAITISDNGYAAAGLQNGNFYISKNYFLKNHNNVSSLILKQGPSSATKINTLAIDRNYRLFAGNALGQFYSDDAFSNDTSSGCTWTQITGECEIKTMHIDRSKTNPAPFVKILNRDKMPQAAGIICAPSIIADDCGLHVFYLDDSSDSPNGETLSYPKLYYVKSPDFGKNWSNPVRVCKTPDGRSAWAHSEAVDKNGTLHAMWQSEGESEWKIYYQQSSDGGASWLAQDKCIYNKFNDKPLHRYSFKSGAESNWVKYASDKFSRLSVMSNNTIYGTASSNDYNNFYYSFISINAGAVWNQNNAFTAFKPFESTTGYVESINVLSEQNKIIDIVTYGDNYSKRVFFEIEPYGSVPNLNLNFSFDKVVDSAAPCVNDEMNFLYCLSQKNSSNEIVLRSVFAAPPYTSISSCEINITPKLVYRPQLAKNDAYLFFATDPDAAIGSNSKIKGRVFMAKSTSSGINYSAPVFIDYLYGAYDYLATANYASIVYMIKKSPDPSASSNLYFSSIPDELMFVGTKKTAYVLNPEMLPNPAFEEFELDETPNGFASDGDGNILCATSNGLYVRNIKTANAILRSSGGEGAVDSNVNFPLSLSKYESFTDPKIKKLGWLKYFEGMNITCAFAEKGGVYWVGTLTGGLYRSNDYGRNWKHIESRLASISDIKCVVDGNAMALNKLNIVSKRFNVAANDASKLVIETLYILYNLASESIESFNVAASETVNSPAKAVSESKAFAACNNQSDGYAYYTPSSRNVYFKKLRQQNITIVQAADASDVNVYKTLNINIEKNDTVEININGKLRRQNGINAMAPVKIPVISYFDEPPFIGTIDFKIGDYTFESSNYSLNKIPQGGTLNARLKNFTCTGGEDQNSKKFIKEANCELEINITKAEKQLKTNAISNIDSLEYSPDGESIFAISSKNNIIYELKGVNSDAITISEYSKNIAEPFKILFSTTEGSAGYKTYIACRKNIADLAGNLYLEAANDYEIDDAVITDNNELLFSDKKSMKIYKCPRTNKKTVIVTVVDKGENIYASIAPTSFAKDFYSYSSNGAQGSKRKYIKYNYIYTSKEYPGAIPAGSEKTWTSINADDSGIMNIYIVDSILKIEGKLAINEGCIVKFATGDKTTYPANFSGKGESCLMASADQLIVYSNAKTPVIFTSLDDHGVAPSVYNAPDGQFKSDDGLQSIQLRKVHFTPPYNYEDVSGVRYGDWGYSDGSSERSYGGIYTPNSFTSSSMLKDVIIKYALLYTQNIYKYHLLTFNFTDYPTKWNRTNVYVTGDGEPLALKNQGELKIDQGAIIKFKRGSTLSIYELANRKGTHFTLVSDGSPHYPVVMEPLGTQGDKEGIIPYQPADSGYFKGLSFEESGDISSLRNTKISNALALDFNYSNAYFNGCTITSGFQSLVLSFSNADASKFYNNEFNLYYPSRFELTTRSCIELNSNTMRFFYSSGAGGNHDSFIKSSHTALAVLDENYFYNSSDILSSATTSFNGSKISVGSTAYITRNNFLNSSQGIPITSGCSCEIIVNNAASPSLALISSNYFMGCKLPVYISGFKEGGLLKNSIINNSFVNCDKLIVSDNDSSGGKCVSKFVSPVKSVLDREENIYTLDNGTGSVYKHNRSGDIIYRLGKKGSANEELENPTAIAINETGEIYIADTANKNIKKLTALGKYILKFSPFGEGKGKVKNVSAIACATSKNSEILLVADSENNKLLKFSNAGNFIEEIGVRGSGLDEFDAPSDIICSKDGSYAFLADKANNRVLKIRLNSDEAKTEKFDITVKAYSAAATDQSGFVESASCDEGDYFEFNVTARKANGAINIDYLPNSGGIIQTDYKNGAITWEGIGITDSGDSLSNNSAAYSKESFNGGIAKFYARCDSAGQSVKITIKDNTNSKLIGETAVEWVPEAAQRALSYEGVNSRGFRRYSATNDPGVKFIKIPGFNFQRSSSSSASSVDTIKMSPYFISEAPITNEQFNVWRTNSQSPPPLSGGWKWLESDSSKSQAANFPEHPAIDVSFEDAKNYSYWLICSQNQSQTDAYLPSEAQYEKAMRGADMPGMKNTVEYNLFPWGASFSESRCNSYASIASDERPLYNKAGTTPVKKYQPQGYYGLYDISGNVWQWCRDWYAQSYSGSKINPVNSNVASERSVRGGSWYDSYQSSFTCSARFSNKPDYGYSNFGFRPCFTYIK